MLRLVRTNFSLVIIKVGSLKNDWNKTFLNWIELNCLSNVVLSKIQLFWQFFNVCSIFLSICVEEKSSVCFFVCLCNCFLSGFLLRAFYWKVSFSILLLSYLLFVFCLLVLLDIFLFVLSFLGHTECLFICFAIQ